MSDAAFFHGRRLTYEIYVLTGGRWQLRQRMDDGREEGREFNRFDFERLEANTLKIATSFLRVPGIQAVKVMREREGPSGMSLATEIFRRDAAPGVDRSIARHLNEPLPPILDVADLSRRPAARAFSIIARDFLATTRTTAVECLHHMPSLRRLSANANLYRSLVHQIAGKQAEARQIAVTAAVTSMHAQFDEVERRARMAYAEKGYVQLARLPYGTAHAQLAGGSSGDALRFHVFVLIARRLEGTPSGLARLGWALDAIDEVGGTEAAGQVDEFVANCLDDPKLMMDLLGAQPNLAIALSEIAAVAEGTFEGGRRTADELRRLNAACGAGFLPLTRAALWERIARSVDSTAPLNRKDSDRELGTTLDLAIRLEKIAPGETLPHLREGFARRERYLRDRD